MDWDEHSEFIKIASTWLNHIKSANESLLFFYDESNNIRKYHNKNGSFNAGEYQNFSLGGIVLINSCENKEFNDLTEILDFGKNDNFSEFKLKHFLVKKGKSFIEKINSQKLNILLEYLYLKQGVFIHFQILNFFYYGIVDIVDTLFEREQVSTKNELDNLKTFIYKKMIADYNYWSQKFWEYDYPNVSTEQMANFLDDLISYFVKARTYTTREHKLKERFISLCSRRKRALRDSEHILLSGNKPNSLVDSLSEVYQERIFVYNHSYHIFDEEYSISEKWKEIDFYEWGINKKFEFRKSETDIRIQISDVLAGIIAKLFDFLSQIYDIAELENILGEIPNNSNSYKVLKHLFFLISKSDSFDRYFIKYIAPQNDIEKFRFMYRYFLDKS
ncbi:hypothetical protein MKL29_07200 [Streptococcus suis]|nr:hypothetical protein [Streptococcus suis]